jgi:hypothetical protein
MQLNLEPTLASLLELVQREVALFSSTLVTHSSKDLVARSGFKQAIAPVEKIRLEAACNFRRVPVQLAAHSPW